MLKQGNCGNPNFVRITLSWFCSVYAYMIVHLYHCNHTSFKAGGYRLPFLSLGGLQFLLALPVFMVLIRSSREFANLKLYNIKMVV